MSTQHPSRFFRLRIVEGPLEGATYHLRDSFVLGRSGVCDLVVLDRRVSRLHARVGRDASGEHVLHDMGSVNGTRVNGTYVRQRHLVPGDEITIGDCRFVYEAVPPAAPGAGVAGPLPAAGGSPLPTSGAPPAGNAGEAPEPPQYDGNLLDDVITYRSLAAAIVRGDHLDTRAIARFRALDAKLRDDASVECFHEFPFSMRARVRAAWSDDASEEDVVVTSFGVGGVTYVAPNIRTSLQEILHVVLDLQDLGLPTKIALTGVVVAIGPGQCRISFSMSTGWAARMASFQHAKTMPMVPVRVPAPLRAATHVAPGIQR